MNKNTRIMHNPNGTLRREQQNERGDTVVTIFHRDRTHRTVPVRRYIRKFGELMPITING